MKTGNSLLMSVIKFSHMFFDLFTDKKEKFVPDGFQRCSQMNTSRRIERNSYGLVKWAGGQLLG
jgi:hypothetical protein